MFILPYQFAVSLANDIGRENVSVFSEMLHFSSPGKSERSHKAPKRSFHHLISGRIHSCGYLEFDEATITLI